MHMQNNSHLFAGRAPLLARWRQIASGRCEKLPLVVEIIVSECSALWEKYSSSSVVRKSRIVFFELANQAPLRSIRNILEMCSLQSGRLSPSGPLGLLGRAGSWPVWCR